MQPRQQPPKGPEQQLGALWHEALCNALQWNLMATLFRPVQRKFHGLEEGQVTRMFKFLPEKTWLDAHSIRNETPGTLNTDICVHSLDKLHFPVSFKHTSTPAGVAIFGRCLQQRIHVLHFWVEPDPSLVLGPVYLRDCCVVPGVNRQFLRSMHLRNLSSLQCQEKGRRIRTVASSHALASQVYGCQAKSLRPILKEMILKTYIIY